MVEENKSQFHIYKFNDQLNIGEIGEQTFLNKFNKEIESKKNSREPDFRIISTDEFIELKTDNWTLSNIFSYKTKETPNIFMEQYSDYDRKTIGGPWRAKKENCKYFIYYFINNDIFFVFNTDLLVSVLDIVTKNKTLKLIPNVKWITAGYPIPRKILEPIAYSSDKNIPYSLNECIDMLKNTLNKIDTDKYISWAQKAFSLSVKDQIKFINDESSKKF
jgi:hypothetical protein